VDQELALVSRLVALLGVHLIAEVREVLFEVVESGGLVVVKKQL
jgi:hypothetical protein